MNRRTPLPHRAGRSTISLGRHRYFPPRRQLRFFARLRVAGRLRCGGSEPFDLGAAHPRKNTVHRAEAPSVKEYSSAPPAAAPPAAPMLPAIAAVMKSDGEHRPYSGE